MTICSSLLQRLIVWSGYYRRRYIGKYSPYLAIFVWFNYLLSNWMATIVSTLLKTHAGRQPRGELVAFWSPFVLWHLGGPYNITAYSLEDNAQWLRHFFGFVLQTGEVIYIFSVYGSGARYPALIFIACPILIAGIIKYGEKIWALRCANEKELVRSLYSPPAEAAVKVKRCTTNDQDGDVWR